MFVFLNYGDMGRGENIVELFHEFSNKNMTD